MEVEERQAMSAIAQKHLADIAAQAAKAREKVQWPSPGIGAFGGATSSPESASSPVQSVLISEGVAQGLLVHKVEPVYPPLARQARIQGTVVLQCLIGTDGTIQELHLQSGHPMLVSAAMDAVKLWQYMPYSLYGHLVEVQTTINVNFVLEGAAK
jgi:periplasmic protein TonB